MAYDHATPLQAILPVVQICNGAIAARGIADEDRGSASEKLRSQQF